MSLSMAGVLLWLAPAIRESLPSNRHEVPIVVTTWAFTAAPTDAAWAVLASAGTDASALAAVEEVCMHLLELYTLFRLLPDGAGASYENCGGWYAGLQHL